MSVGIHLINANSQVTFSDDKEYWVFKSKFVYADRVTAYSSTSSCGFDSGYSGAQPPMFFLRIDDYCGFRWLSKLSSTGNWIIQFQNLTSLTTASFELYMFLPYADTTATSPTWGIKIKNSDGTKAYDSDMKILNVGGFETVNNPSSNPSCSDSTKGNMYHTSSTSIADYGFSKPCFMLPEDGVYLANCTPNADMVFTSLMKYVHSSRTIYHGWYNWYGSTGTNSWNINITTPSSGMTVPVIDGADYD